jgi:hypothetical protein
MTIDKVVKNKRKAILCVKRDKLRSLQSNDYFVPFYNPNTYRLVGEILGQYVFIRIKKGL